MSRPTRQEYDRAFDLGAQARRAGRKLDANPYRNGRTEKDRVLAEAWADGWDSADRKVRR